MGKVGQVINGESGGSTRAKYNEAMETVEVGSNITGTGQLGDPLEVAAPGEDNTNTNVGTGAQVAKAKVGVNTPLRTIKAGTNVTVDEDTNEIVINASAGSGEANTSSNSGTGEGLALAKSGVDLPFKGIKVTGPLTISGDPTSVTIDMDAAEFGLQSGITTGGVVTINADPTKFDVSAGTGTILDWSNPLVPVVNNVSWTAFIAQTVPNLATEVFTTIAINAAGALVLANAIYTGEDRRTLIICQSITHTGGTQIETVGKSSVPSYQKIEAVLDYISKLGPITVGNTYSANVGADLTIDKASGDTTSPFINRSNDTQNPTILVNGQLLATSLLRVFQDGIGGFNFAEFAAVDPEFFDDGSGTLVAMPNNKYQIQRCFYFGVTNQTLITYGQATYSSIAEAEAAIFSESPVTTPLTFAGTFTTALIVKKGTTDLTNLTNAKFVNISTATSSGSASLQNMQQVYNNSLQPQTVVTDALGAIVEQNGRALDTSTVREVKNIGGTVTHSITGEGDLLSKDVKVTGEAFVDEEEDNGNSGTTETIDWTFKNFQKSTLTDDVTYTFTAPSGPTTMILRLIQDATGTRLATFPGTVKWSGGTAPTLTTDPAAVDLVTFYFDGANYNGSFILDVK